MELVHAIGNVEQSHRIHRKSGRVELMDSGALYFVLLFRTAIEL